MASEKQGSPMVVSVGVYLVQIGVILLLVLHRYGSKDTDIIVSLLIAMYGMNTAQTAGESAISGLHFLSLMKRLGRPTDADQTVSAEVEELTQKEAPYTFAHVLFGFVIALIGAAKLVYVIFVE